MKDVIELENKIKELEESRKEIWAQIKPLNDKVALISAEIKTTYEKYTKEKLKTDMSEQERFDFLMEESGSSIGILRYKVAYDYIRSIGLYMTGYCQFSEQRLSNFFIYELNIDKNKKTISELKKLASLYKPMDEHGNKFFGLFCKDINVVLSSDNVWSLKNSHTDLPFSSLEELFEYYIQHHDCHDSDN